MKKAFQISLAGTLFTIEDDAHQKLDSYLSSIKERFAHTDGRDEIMRDIEARIAEKFLETGKSIITLDEVDAVMKSMGSAADFQESGAEEMSAEKKEKKLYRNPDDKIIAGVSSGIGTYLGIDPLWIRILFVVLTIALNGFALLIYALLWIIIPEAKTAAQKLEMQGSPVTIETLGKNIKETVEEKVGEVEAKHGSRIKRILSLPFLALKKIIEFVKKVFFPLVRVLFGLALGLASLAAIFGLSFAGPFVLSSPERLADFPLFEVFPRIAVYISVVGAYFTLAVPAALLFLLAISSLRKKMAIKAGLGFGLLGIWILAIALLGGSSAVMVASYQDYADTNPAYETVSRTIPLEGKIAAIDVSNGQRVAIVEGKDQKLVANGRSKDIENAIVSLKDGTLSIRSGRMKDACIFCDRRTPEFTLTVENLSLISASHGSSIHADSVTFDKTDIRAQNGSRISIDSLSGGDLRARAEHGSDISVEGTAEHAELSASNGSRIDAFGLVLKNAEADSQHGSEINLTADATLDAKASNGGAVFYRGNAIATKDASSGGFIEKRDSE